MDLRSVILTLFSCCSAVSGYGNNNDGGNIYNNSNDNIVDDKYKVDKYYILLIYWTLVIYNSYANM